VVLHGGVCPCCSARFKAPAPEGLEPGSPFGPNLRAFAIYLRVAHAVSFERLSRLMSDLVGLKISEGALVNMLAASRPAFARAAALIRAKLLSGTILQSDETGARVGKKSWWTWVFHHGQDCCFSIRPSRGKDVVEAFLGEHRPDFWVSDRHAAQMGWAKKDNQVCLAHLIREATYAVEAGDSNFALALRKLLKRACGIARRRPDLADATLRTYADSLNAKLDALLRLTPTHAAGAKLKQAIAGCRRHLFVFLEDRAIPAHQQRLRAGAAPLRRLSQGDQLLPLRMGRRALRRHPLSHRNRPTQRRRRLPGHPPDAQPAAPNRYGVSNYYASP